MATHWYQLRAQRTLQSCFRMLQTADNPDNSQWLPGAKFSIAEAALCNRQADAIAIVWADESTPDRLTKISLGQLKQQCQLVMFC